MNVERRGNASGKLIEHIDDGGGRPEVGALIDAFHIGEIGEPIVLPIDRRPSITEETDDRPLRVASNFSDRAVITSGSVS